MEQPILIINKDKPSVDVLEEMKKYARVLSKAPIRVLILGSKETGNEAMTVVRRFGLKQAPSMVVGSSVFSGARAIIEAIPKYLEVMRQLEMQARQIQSRAAPARPSPQSSAQLDAGDLHAMMVASVGNPNDDPDDDESPDAVEKAREERRTQFMHDLSMRGGKGSDKTSVVKPRQTRTDAQEVPISRDDGARPTQTSDGRYEEDPAELVRAHMLGDWGK